MSTNPRLEIYLTQLDKALGPIAISEKAEIISEIKSHVLETQERNPDKSMASILESFGEPEAVATRYLTERGLKPAAPAKRQVVKWLTIGFLGAFAMTLLFVVVLIFKFTPLIKVHDEDGREKVELFGGMLNINVDEDAFSFEGEDLDFKFNLSSDSDHHWIKESKELDAEQIKSLNILFNNGMMELSSHDEAILSWKCKVTGDKPIDYMKEQGEFAVLDFSNSKKTKCKVTMPKNLKPIVKGNNGKIELIRPTQDSDIVLQNGKCDIEPDETLSYSYDLKVNQGKLGDFVSSSDPNAIKIKVRLKNGLISN